MSTIEQKLKEYKGVPGFVCPAEFWPALGYEGEARYVGIWWEPGGDEASWSDGRRALCGAEWVSYLALMKANFSAGHPAHWLLGSSEEPAAFHLVIDRVTEWAWLVPWDEAWEVLRLQWPHEDDELRAVVAFEELMEIVEQLRARPGLPTMEEIRARIERQAALHEVFVKALERRREVSAVSE